ncbi:hypothetical protein C882_2695 [Caenispirillum salinarum AK4]|uniref:DUF2938 domain-containing protein n=2 Tax=Caenispirillum TaxID=414051 RepID=K9HWS5_9PROT|nr:hypothetical protein C882_2695 [Caenispirillum salinarum AK4]
MMAPWSTLVDVVLIGIGATLVADVWAILQQALFRLPMLNLALVGRWVGHFPRGRIRHVSIAAAEPVPGEAALGWFTHYVVGIAFAAVLVAGWGTDWVRAPTLPPALIVGAGTVVFPFFIMQPAFGLGLAGAKTPNPRMTRVRSLLAHLSFGLGLYLAGLAVSLLPI